MSSLLRIGTAGWTVPAAVRAHFPQEGTHLERYARVFSCAEINSSFHKEHSTKTYEKWASAVPEGFRFSVKLPKEVSHKQKLASTSELPKFFDQVAGLQEKLGVLLVQLPPKLSFDDKLVTTFFSGLRRYYAGRIACEPRHISWRGKHVAEVLKPFAITFVEADPAPVFKIFKFNKKAGLRYLRLHGSPRMYYSSYAPEFLQAVTVSLRSAEVESWCIFDNTAAGAAAQDALSLQSRVSEG